jgi:hypothetical protein
MQCRLLVGHLYQHTRCRIQENSTYIHIRQHITSSDTDWKCLRFSQSHESNGILFRTSCVRFIPYPFRLICWYDELLQSHIFTHILARVCFLRKMYQPSGQCWLRYLKDKRGAEVLSGWEQICSYLATALRRYRVSSTLAFLTTE